jgi:transcriptional regulator with XRE-family HTH domain
MGSESESNELVDWLRAELEARGLTQMQLAARAGVGQATISDILAEGHLPKVDSLLPPRRLPWHLA